MKIYPPLSGTFSHNLKLIEQGYGEGSIPERIAVGLSGWSGLATPLEGCLGWVLGGGTCSG